MSGSQLVNRFLDNIHRAKTDRLRCIAACELKRYIAGDLQEEGQERYNNFIDELNHRIVGVSTNGDDKKGIILAIVALIEADSKSSSQPHRYNKTLVNINHTCNDNETMRLSTWAMGRLVRAEGSLYDRYVMDVMSKAFEMLEFKTDKMAALLIIREMAINAPTNFYQRLKDFRKLIPRNLRDPKREIRFAAIACLRASLTIVAQRESALQHNAEDNDKKSYYRELLDRALFMLKKDEERKGLISSSSRDDDRPREKQTVDEIKGGIMIINELLRCATKKEDLLTYEENCIGGPEDLSLLKIIGLSSLEMENACLINDVDPTEITSFDRPSKVFGEEGHQFSQQCKMLLHDISHTDTSITNFRLIGESLLKYKYSKNAGVQFLLTETLPRLASFDGSAFADFLTDTFNYLTNQAKLVRPLGVTSPTAFLAMGQIAYSMQGGIICYIDRVFAVVRPYIPNPRDLTKYKRTVDPAIEGHVLQLISLLAKASKDNFYKYIVDCIDGMLLMSLTKSLTDCLAVLHQYVPDIKERIEDGLLNIFSYIIMDVPYIKDDKPYPISRDYQTPTDEASKLLAIKTIGEFRFEDKLLKQFITHLAKEYLNNPEGKIRRVAAKTCARKLIPCVKASSLVGVKNGHHYSNHALMSEVLSKLLTVVIADPLPEIRLTTLREFSPEFYKQLALSQNIQLLFLAVNDPCHDVREVVLELLGHLSEENPAYILPFLREQLSHILHQLEHSGIARNKEKAAKLLQILIMSAQPTLVRLYLKPIMASLLPKLTGKECSSTIFRHILACVSQLAKVDGETMKEYLNELFPFLIERISDPKEREPSLRAMCYLVHHTGYVVEPYNKYPKLLHTLLGIISTDQTAKIREDCMRLLGQLGALSPYKNNTANLNELKKFPITQPVPQEDVSFNTSLTSELLIKIASDSIQKQADPKGTNLEHQYYPCVVIHALVNILQDPALTEYHTQVVQIIQTVFRTLGSTGTVGYLPKVMPVFLANIRACDPRSDRREVDSYFNQLADLIKVVGVHIKPYASPIIELIIDLWGKVASPTTTMMVVDKLITALGGEFKTYIARLIPLIMKVLHDDRSPEREASILILGRLGNFGASLDNFLHLLLPQIVAIITEPATAPHIKKTAVNTLTSVAGCANYSDHASLMIHALVNELNYSVADSEMDELILGTIVAIAKQLGDKFRAYKQLVMSVVTRKRLVSPELDSFLTQLSGSDIVPPIYPPLTVLRPPETLVHESAPSGLQVNVENLVQAWQVKNLFHKDLVRWLRQLKIEFLKYTPNPALRACCLLANYQSLPEVLFNAVFVSIWSDQLTEQQQDELESNLRRVLETHSLPEVTLDILNLQEFMEHWGKGVLDIRNEVYIKAAKRCNSYAKALRYVEKDFQHHQEPGTLVELLRINNILQQPKAALGVLKYAQLYPGKLSPEDSWYEELQQWSEALNRYNVKLERGAPHVTHVLGKLRCLEALNKWDDMQSTIENFWGEQEGGKAPLVTAEMLSAEQSSQMAGLAATAAWRLSRWKDLEKYTDNMEMCYQRHFFSALIQINKGNYTAAQDLISQSRNTLDQEITVIVKEGYHRLYTKIVDMHMLSEMEDVLGFKNPSNCREYKSEADMIKKDAIRKDRLREVWWNRLQGCQRNVSDWSRILEVHKLVLEPREDIRAWLKFSSIAQKSGRRNLSKKILLDLIGRDPATSELDTPMDPHVAYQYFKHQWNTAGSDNDKAKAFEMLSIYVDQGPDSLDASSLNRPLDPTLDGSMNHQDTLDDLNMDPGIIGPIVDRRLKCKYKLKQGLWLYDLNTSKRSPNAALDALQFFEEAKNLDSRYYKGWNKWAKVSLEAAQPETLEAKKSELRKVEGRIRRVYGAGSEEDEEDEFSEEDDEEDSDDDLVRLPEPSDARAREVSREVGMGDELVGELMEELVEEMVEEMLEEIAEELVEELAELHARKKALTQEISFKYKLITAAVQGFIESIALTLETNRLEDILKLLTLWFSHGSNAEVGARLSEGIKRIPMNIWIQVIPQLIARIDIPNKNVRELIHRVLNDVGREHPQALIYPLSVAKKSGDGDRSKYAGSLLKLMGEHSKQIVEEGVMFSNELIRIAISWSEQWYDALDRASRMHYNGKNTKGMFDILYPMHRMVNPEKENPEAIYALTDQEKSFKNLNGKELDEAFALCQLWKRSQAGNGPDHPEISEGRRGREDHIESAWAIYLVIYRRTNQAILQMSSVRLEDSSPRLLKEARDMLLAVPGTYDPGQPVIRIHSVDPHVGVIKSKQRPRKLSMIGSDGLKYTFLLKGNEDLRQDERAMQLFGLVNSLLAHSQTTSEQNLSIQRYSVIPLSPHSGLSGWRPHSDTLHQLIKDHRVKTSVDPSLENKLCTKYCLSYEKLPLMMKIEVFEEVLNCTTGEDLAIILYQKSPSAEIWFERRRNYILSHAVMCMVGYILGLGDRHPSNIMMDRKTGNLIHCDFGECFDVSRDREKFPETIPFRLTRMMRKAMEVTGIHGTYTLTCNDVMEVMRNNATSVLAVLETFVYDPLINWRLVECPDFNEKNTQINARAVEVLSKVKKKLYGVDDITEKNLEVVEQVQSLIRQATLSENLCQLYPGWCPFW